MNAYDKADLVTCSISSELPTPYQQLYCQPLLPFKH